MPESQYPQLNKLYASSILFAGVGSGVFMAYMAVYRSSDMGASAITILVALVLAFGAIFVVRDAARLVVGESEISSGQTVIKWQEVEDVKIVGYGLHLKARNRKIKVAPYAYQNSEKLMLFIQKALSNAP